MTRLQRAPRGHRVDGRMSQSRGLRQHRLELAVERGRRFPRSRVLGFSRTRERGPLRGRISAGRDGGALAAGGRLAARGERVPR